MYIFISHSSKDAVMAEETCDLLERNGHRCFLAPRDISSGAEYAEEIVNGIDRADIMIVLLSKAANNSPHVLREVERAVSKKVPIIVYKLEEVELSKSMEYFLMTHQWINEKQKDGYEEILRSVEAQQKKAGFEKVGFKKTGVVFFLCALVLIAVLVCLVIRWPDDTDGNAAQEVSKEVSKEVSLGDTIVLGNYDGEPIEWRVLKISGDGTEAVVVAQNILTMKAYDAAESGKYNYYEDKDYWTEDISAESKELQQLLRGNNDWSVSNIRAWLNSARENVTYEGQKPSVTAMSAGKNGYDTEPGFLSGFSEEELAVIVVTEVKTGESVTEDKVFLLSREEMEWFEAADVSLMAKPTTAAVEKDQTDWYELFSLEYGVEDYYWWLRDSSGTNYYEAGLVGNSYNDGQLLEKSVGLEGFGIRPAMTIKLGADCMTIK